MTASCSRGRRLLWSRFRRPAQAPRPGTSRWSGRRRRGRSAPRPARPTIPAPAPSESSSACSPRTPAAPATSPWPRCRRATVRWTNSLERGTPTHNLVVKIGLGGGARALQPERPTGAAARRRRQPDPVRRLRSGRQPAEGRARQRLLSQLHGEHRHDVPRLAWKHAPALELRGGGDRQQDRSRRTGLEPAGLRR